MRHAACAQMLAHRQPGLAAADNQRVNLFDWHLGIPSYGAMELERLVYRRGGQARIIISLTAG